MSDDHHLSDDNKVGVAILLVAEGQRQIAEMLANLFARLIGGRPS